VTTVIERCDNSALNVSFHAKGNTIAVCKQGGVVLVKRSKPRAKMRARHDGSLRQFKQLDDNATQMQLDA
jgi:hypothetical protein